MCDIPIQFHVTNLSDPDHYATARKEVFIPMKIVWRFEIQYHNAIKSSPVELFTITWHNATEIV